MGVEFWVSSFRVYDFQTPSGYKAIGVPPLRFCQRWRCKIFLTLWVLSSRILVGGVYINAPVLLKLACNLGRALGHVICSLVGLKRILFTNIFQKL